MGLLHRVGLAQTNVMEGLETAGAGALEMAVAAMLKHGGKVSPCKNCTVALYLFLAIKRFYSQV